MFIHSTRPIVCRAFIGLSYAALAEKIGQSEARVVQSKYSSLFCLKTVHKHCLLVCTGADHPTTAEFNALASALDITQAVSRCSCTRVIHTEHVPTGTSRCGSRHQVNAFFSHGIKLHLYNIINIILRYQSVAGSDHPL